MLYFFFHFHNFEMTYRKKNYMKIINKKKNSFIQEEEKFKGISFML